MQFKNFLCTLIILSFINLSTVQAQAPKWFGLDVGAGTSMFLNQNAYASPELDYKWKTAYLVGAKFGWNHRPKQAITLGVQLANQGANYEATYRDTTFVRKFNLNYVQLPIMYHWRPKVNESGFFAEIGLQLGYMLSASYDFDPIVPSIEGVAAEELYTTIDGGLAMVLGYILDINDKMEIQLGWRGYTAGADLNTFRYRYKNKAGEYDPSFNFSSLIKADLVWHIGGKNDWFKKDEE